MGKKRSAGNVELVGGRLCLNFANTVSSRTEVPYREYLPSYGELVTWGQHVGVLSGDEATALQIHAARDPDLAVGVLDRAIALREAIYRVFWAIADHREPEEADLVLLNEVLHNALARLEVRPSVEGFEWAWASGDDGLDRMLWPVARSAADLLTSEDLGRVRKCASEVCDWLFVDASKNRSRRWCTMGVCGSRAKSRRYYRRRKREKESET
jgi:predicted RNA-binding Zn ribbon-like protein